MAATPLLLQRRHMRLMAGQGGSLIASEKPLTDAQVRRGAYQNTGTRDCGIDPDWDLKTMTWKGKKAVIADESMGYSR